jgi:hypothetical protein
MASALVQFTFNLRSYIASFTQHPTPHNTHLQHPPTAPSPVPSQRRTELDYGLGRRAEGKATENLLVVANAAAIGRLVGALSPTGSSGDGTGSSGSSGSSGGSSAGGVVEVAVDSWNLGVAADQQKALGSWRSLKPRVAPQSSAATAG